MAEYQVTEGGGILRRSDEAFIPNDPDNRDRREFIEWVAAGGIPDPIEEPIPDPEEEFRESLRLTAIEKIVTNAGLSEEEAAIIFG